MMNQQTYTRLKSNLTRARNSADPIRVLSHVADAFGYFESDGYPDDWHRWQRAADDIAYDPNVSNSVRCCAASISLDFDNPHRADIAHRIGTR